MGLTRHPENINRYEKRYDTATGNPFYYVVLIKGSEWVSVIASPSNPSGSALSGGKFLPLEEEKFNEEG